MSSNPTFPALCSVSDRAWQTLRMYVRYYRRCASTRFYHMLGVGVDIF